MANWSDLKSAVASIIKTNGAQQITGQLLQNVLNNIISNVGLNSTFAGIATPETNPGTPDGNVFYLATTEGTYSNFNGIIIEAGEAVILEWKGSWTKKTSGFATQEKLSELSDLVFAVSGSVTLLDYNKINITNINIFRKTDSTQKNVHVNKDFSFDSENGYVLVLTKDNGVIQKEGISAVLNTDVLLLSFYPNFGFSGGELLPLVVGQKYAATIESKEANVISSIGIKKTKFFKGGFDKQGKVIDVNNRAYSNYISNLYGLTVSEGWMFHLYAYDKSGSYFGETEGWSSDEWKIPNSNINEDGDISKLYRVVVKKVDDSDFEVNEALENINIYREDDNVHQSNYTLLNTIIKGEIIWQNGAIQADNKYSTSAAFAKRLHSNIIYGVTKITATNGYSYAYIVFNEDGTYDNSGLSSWKTEDTIFDIPKSVRININNSQQDITPDEGVNIIVEKINIGHNKSIVGNKLKGKKLSILGDSISTFGTPNQDNTEGTWCYPGNKCRYPQDNLLTNVNDMYWKRLIDKYGMVYGINESWRGTLVSWDGVTETTVIGANKHIASETRINHLGENGTPDIILVYAGTNDAGGNVDIGVFNTENPVNYTDQEISNLPVDTFANAYRTLIIRLLKKYSNSKIVVCLPNFVGPYPTEEYYTITDLDKYIEVIKEVCDFFGVKYVDLRTSGINIYNKATYLPDNIHPNAKGMELLYKLLCSEVFDGLNSNGI